MIFIVLIMQISLAHKHYVIWIKWIVNTKLIRSVITNKDTENVNRAMLNVCVFLWNHYLRVIDTIYFVRETWYPGFGFTHKYSYISFFVSEFTNRKASSKKGYFFYSVIYTSPQLRVESVIECWYIQNVSKNVFYYSYL